jgi:hypothetical protein
MLLETDFGARILAEVLCVGILLQALHFCHVIEFFSAVDLSPFWHSGGLWALRNAGRCEGD